MAYETVDSMNGITDQPFDHWRKISEALKKIPEGYDFVVVDGENVPAPPIAPRHENPVMGVKREAAIAADYRPEVTEDLYNTPATIYFTRENPFEDNVGGYYQNPIRQSVHGGDAIELYVPPFSMKSNWPSDVIQHEYAHKAFFEGTKGRAIGSEPLDRMVIIPAWQFHGMNMLPDEMEQGARESYSPDNPGSVPAKEVYAEAATVYGQNLPKDIRKLYYHDMWKDPVQPIPNKPFMQPRMQPSVSYPRERSRDLPYLEPQFLSPTGAWG